MPKAIFRCTFANGLQGVGTVVDSSGFYSSTLCVMPTSLPWLYCMGLPWNPSPISLHIKFVSRAYKTPSAMSL